MKTLDQLRQGKEYVHRAKCQGAPVIQNGGSHAVIKGPKGMAVVPVHPGDLGKGLRCKINKTWIAIGLTVIAAIGYVGSQLIEAM